MSGWTNEQPLSLTIGPIPGQHIIIINPATGDAIDVYDASNNLIFKIDAAGEAISYVPGGGQAGLISGGVQISAALDPTFTHPAILQAVNTDPGFGDNQLALLLEVIGKTISYQGAMLAGSDDSTLGPTFVGNERQVVGSYVQSDDQSVNNLVHLGSYSVATNASGIGTFAHGAAFTPKGGVATANAVVAASATQFSFQTGAWTGTDATVAVKTPAGAAYVGTATFYAAFWG